MNSTGHAVERFSSALHEVDTAAKEEGKDIVASAFDGYSSQDKTHDRFLCNLTPLTKTRSDPREDLRKVFRVAIGSLALSAGAADSLAEVPSARTDRRMVPYNRQRSTRPSALLAESEKHPERVHQNAARAPSNAGG